MDKDVFDKRIVIYDDTLSIWESIMAAIMYTFTVAVLLIMFGFFFICGINEKTFSMTPSFVTLIFTFLTPAIIISEINIVELDLINNKIFTTKKIVFYKKTKVIDALNFEYVALNKSGFSYFITIWFKGNRHYRILSFYKKDKAFLYAISLCKQTNVDLLDKSSSISKWIKNSDL